MVVYDKDDDLVIFLIYVEDIFVIRNNQDMIHTIIRKLNYVFALKDLGILSYFLRIEVTKGIDYYHLY